MIIEIRYPAGHTISEEWKECELFCPNCGLKKVWKEQGQGDYYQGPEHICAGCGNQFSIQGPIQVVPNHISAFRILEVIRRVHA
jgi:predicted RNA-binding Zn-ribbon protein involved in translation (DUF1610 family)